MPARRPPQDDETTRLLAAAQGAPDILTILGADGTILFNSPIAEQIHGYPVADMIGRDTMEYVHPEDRAAVEAGFKQLFEEPDKPVRVTYRYRHKLGHYTWMEATGRNRLDDPRVRGIVAVSRDLSQAPPRPGAGTARSIPVDSGVYEPRSREVVRVAARIPLTAAEAKLLEYLAARPGELIPADQLLRDVWKYAGAVKSRTVYVTVERLRKKVERDPKRPRCLVSRPGLGYGYKPPA